MRLLLWSASLLVASTAAFAEIKADRCDPINTKCPTTVNDSYVEESSDVLVRRNCTLDPYNNEQICIFEIICALFDEKSMLHIYKNVQKGHYLCHENSGKWVNVDDNNEFYDQSRTDPQANITVCSRLESRKPENMVQTNSLASTTPTPENPCGDDIFTEIKTSLYYYQMCTATPARHTTNCTTTVFCDPMNKDTFTRRASHRHYKNQAICDPVTGQWSGYPKQLVEEDPKKMLKEICAIVENPTTRKTPKAITTAKKTTTTTVKPTTRSTIIWTTPKATTTAEKTTTQKVTTTTTVKPTTTTATTTRTTPKVTTTTAKPTTTTTTARTTPKATSTTTKKITTTTVKPTTTTVKPDKDCTDLVEDASISILGRSYVDVTKLNGITIQCKAEIAFHVSIEYKFECDRSLGIWKHTADNATYANPREICPVIEKKIIPRLIKEEIPVTKKPELACKRNLHLPNVKIEEICSDKMCLYQLECVKGYTWFMASDDFEPKRFYACTGNNIYRDQKTKQSFSNIEETCIIEINPDSSEYAKSSVNKE